MSDEKSMARACGCVMYYRDDGDAYETRVAWCDEHEHMAVLLRRILEDFELILADITRKEEATP